MDSKQKGLIWGGVVAMVLLIAVSMARLHSSTATDNTTRGSTMTDNTVIQPYIREVEVGTEWYDPNTEMLRINVTGYPMARDVKWRVRANGDDRTTQHMGAINCGIPDHPKFTNKVDYTECSIEPGQAVTHCKFRFIFSPPKTLASR